jgi:hypothetical protein
MTIEQLAYDTWNRYRIASQQYACVMKKVMPILYFGDYEKYFKSRCRIVSFALNPSKTEFPDGQFNRFPSAAVLSTNPNAFNPAFYLSALNEYFIKDPYWSWFGNIDRVLEGMGASFKGGRQNTALHTDVFSPFPTDPVWGEIESQQTKNALKTEGIKLWRALIKILQPNILIAGISEGDLSALLTYENPHWLTLGTIDKTQNGEPRRNPCEIKCAKINMGGMSVAIVFGKSTKKSAPFDTVTNEDKKWIGSLIYDKLIKAP